LEPFRAYNFNNNGRTKVPATVSIEKERALEHLLQGDALEDDQKAELLASEELRAQTLAAIEETPL
jgi:hypothetical protein